MKNLGPHYYVQRRLVQDQARQLLGIRGIEETNDWFNAKNPLLGDVSPHEMLTLGQYEKLVKLIKQKATEVALCRP